jgi:hypothetical protein
MLTALLTAVIAGVPPAPDWNATPESHQIKRDEISAELQANDRLPQWAGEYLSANQGEGSVETLAIAPKRGFWHQPGGNCIEDVSSTGSIQQSEAPTMLTFTVEASRQKPLKVAELMVIRWGGRNYLLPWEAVTDFCNAINSGGDPSDDARVLMKRGDELKKLGKPPFENAALRRCLLRAPLRASVNRVETRASKRILNAGGSKPPENVTVVTLAAGRKNGVFKGMTLFGGKDGAVKAFVVATGEAESTAELLPEEKAKPDTTWQFASRRTAPDRE